MSEVVASRAPRWSRRDSVREINKVQCYLILETKVKEKRFLLSYIISLLLQVLKLPIPQWIFELF